MTTSPPSPTSITRAQFAHLLSTYPIVLQRVYEAKIKDAKKLAQALEDDAWRYGTTRQRWQCRGMARESGAGEIG
jgi:hypothetical protein